MNLIKSLGVLVVMLIHFNVYSQDFDFNVPELTENSFASMLGYQSQDLFKNRLDSSFSFVANAKMLHDEFSLDFTKLSSQMKNEAFVQERFKDYSEMFSNNCGPLQD